MIQPFWKMVQMFPKNFKFIQPFHLKRNESMCPHKDCMNIHSSFSCNGLKRNVCPSTGAMDKLWYIYITESTVCMDLRIMTLRERSQIKMRTQCLFPFISNSRRCRLVYSDRKQIKWLPGVAGSCLFKKRKTGGDRKGQEDLLGVMDVFII